MPEQIERKLVEDYLINELERSKGSNPDIKELYEELFKTMLNKIMKGEIDVEKIKI